MRKKMKNAQSPVRELTLRGVLLGILLSIILAASNTYLALKIGILTSASIPAAVIAMGILKFFRGSNILENNLVQTAASAGEAIAGGIVYTIPALIIIHYWTHFGYLHNFLIALIGGVLGVLFSVPLRRVLIQDKHLHFPEAQAITKILQMNEKKVGHLRYLLTGGAIGAAIEFAQSGLQIVASSMQGFFTVGKSIIGFGTGFSATLIGAGYLIGFTVGLSLLIGAMVGYLIIMPVLSHTLHITTAQDFIGNQLRFIGIGSLLAAGVWTLLTLLKPIALGIYASIAALNPQNEKKDVPFSLVALGILLALIGGYFLFKNILPFAFLGLSPTFMIIVSLLFILIVGFIFAAICGYFSGLVGVSASPGSAIVIGGLLLVAFFMRTLLATHHVTMTPDIIMNACAVVIVLISVVTGIACITNDNIQDLKVGHLVGSVPWKQQLMLLIGVIAAASVVPLLMQLLFSVYGLGGVYPHAGMDPSKMLPAPVPSVLATVTQAVFARNLPYNMLWVGVGVTVFFIVLNNFILKRFKLHLSILGIAMGLYLPLASSTALFIGSLLALLFRSERGVFNACGLVAGAALMDVLLTIPFAISGNPNVLKILPSHAQPIALVLGVFSVLGLARMFYHGKKKES
jgi:putative OPT family oligopeptide transporter